MENLSLLGRLFNSVGGKGNFLIIVLLFAVGFIGYKARTAIERIVGEYLDESKENRALAHNQTKEIQQVVENNTATLASYASDLKQHSEDSKKSFRDLEEKFDEIEEKIDLTQKTAKTLATKEMVAEIGEDIKDIKKELKHS